MGFVLPMKPIRQFTMSDVWQPEHDQGSEDDVPGIWRQLRGGSTVLGQADGHR